MRTLGIDISYYQHPIDWEKVPKAVTFVICKATQGAKKKGSPRFTELWKGAKASGRIVGAYHLAELDEPVKVQVDRYLTAARPVLQPWCLPPCLDIETKKIDETDGIGPVDGDEAYAWIMEWGTAVRDRTGVRPLLYISVRGVDHLEGHTEGLENVFDLWLCQHTTDPTTPKKLTETPWDDWTLWQYSSDGPGHEWGMEHDEPEDPNDPKGLDLDFFNGSAQDLRAFCALLRWRGDRTFWLTRLLRRMRSALER